MTAPTTTVQPGAEVCAVVGPDAARKAWQMAAPSDLVIDPRALAAAMSAVPGSHGWHVAVGATIAATRAAARLRERVRVYLVHPAATPAQTADYRARGYRVIHASGTATDRR